MYNMKVCSILSLYIEIKKTQKFQNFKNLILSSPKTGMETNFSNLENHFVSKKFCKYINHVPVLINVNIF